MAPCTAQVAKATEGSGQATACGAADAVCSPRRDILRCPTPYTCGSTWRGQPPATPQWGGGCSACLAAADAEWGRTAIPCRRRQAACPFTLVAYRRGHPIPMSSVTLSV
jgi:hypothetical protein